LISIPTEISTIFGEVQAIVVPPKFPTICYTALDKPTLSATSIRPLRDASMIAAGKRLAKDQTNSKPSEKTQAGTHDQCRIILVQRN
jgi:hypothetical protein